MTAEQPKFCVSSIACAFGSFPVRQRRLLGFNEVYDKRTWAYLKALVIPILWSRSMLCKDVR